MAGEGTHGELFSKKALRRLIIPLIIEQALALTVGMADTVMVASAGEAAMSGVSLVESINILLINLFSALASGGAIIAGQYIGKGDAKNGGFAAKQLIQAALVLSVLIGALCAAFNEPVLMGIFGGTEENVMTSAKTYFFMTALSYPFIALYNCSAALFRSMGNSKISMVNSIIMNLVNIIGNAILIYGFGQGVFGAALATLISRIIGAVTMLTMLRNPNLQISVRSYKPEFNFAMVKRILGIGIPNGLENSMFQVGKIITVGLVALGGTTAIAANAVGNSIAAIQTIPGAAMGLALTTIVSQCVGAGEYGQAMKYIKYLMKLNLLYMFILNAVIMLAMNPILTIFNLSDETFAAARNLLFLHGACAIVIWPLSFTLPNAFRAAGDVKFPMTISILSMWLCRIVLSFVFVTYLGMGVFGVWIAMMIDWVFRSAAFVPRLLNGKWKKKALV